MDFFVETSAKNGDNVLYTFVYAAYLLLEESLKYNKIGKINKKNLNLNNKDRTNSHLSFDFVEDEPSDMIVENASLKGKKKCC